jgi:hypothetical protein
MFLFWYEKREIQLKKSEHIVIIFIFLLLHWSYKPKIINGKFS